MSFNNIEATAMLITIVNQTRVKNPDIFNKLFTLYIKSKLTWVIRNNKSMTAIYSKLKDIHANMWGLYDLLL